MNHACASRMLVLGSASLQARIVLSRLRFRHQGSIEGARASLDVAVILRMAEYHFYGALARSAHYDEASADDAIGMETLSAHQKQLNVWAETAPRTSPTEPRLSPPRSHELKAANLDAIRFYEEAIRSARANDLSTTRPLANELAAPSSGAWFFQKIAHVYFARRPNTATPLGADGKVRQLDQLYPHLREGEPTLGQRARSGRRIENLDLATVIKVSQAVSGRNRPGNIDRQAYANRARARGSAARAS